MARNIALSCLKFESERYRWSKKFEPIRAKFIEDISDSNLYFYITLEKKTYLMQSFNAASDRNRLVK